MLGSGLLSVLLSVLYYHLIEFYFCITWNSLKYISDASLLLKYNFQAVLLLLLK